MSEALAVELIHFDDAPRPGPATSGDAPARIGKVLSDAGINVPSTLFNEALALARDGHLGQAQQRLVMLTCLDPDDGDAMMLLSRVHAAQSRWSEALAKLDAATGAGAVASAGYRESLEAAIRAERLREEEQKARVAAREMGEMRALRHETRNLRSETVRLETEVTETLRRESAWKMASFAGGLFSVVVIAFLAITGDSEPTTATLVANAAPPVVEPIADDPTGIVIEKATPAEIAGEAQELPTANAVGDDVTLADAKPVANSGSSFNAAVLPASEVPVLVGHPDPADAPPSLPTTHVVTKNDTLYKLAKTYYGDRSKWSRIADANPQTGPGGTKLSLGMELTIPVE